MRRKVFVGAILALGFMAVVSSGLDCPDSGDRRRYQTEAIALVAPPAGGLEDCTTSFSDSASARLYDLVSEANLATAQPSAGSLPPLATAARPVKTSTPTPATPTPSPTLVPTPVPTPRPTKKPQSRRISAAKQRKKLLWLGWTEFESGEQSWKLTASDGGHAYGRYQFDDRHSLAEFLRFCVNTDRESFESFTTFYTVVDGKAQIKNTDRLEEEWLWICHLQGEKFYQQQTDFALQSYYQPARRTVRRVANVDIEDYGPVLRGTVMSIAIRNGHYPSNMTSVTRTYYRGISEREWLAAIYAAEARRHEDQAERWNGEQKQAALSALAAYQNANSQGEIQKLKQKHSFEAVL